MTYDRDAYYREAFECAMDEEGLWHLVEQMTAEQRANIGSAIAVSVEHEGMAFRRPESPLIAETERLARKLKWTRELRDCPTCNGTGWEKHTTGLRSAGGTCDSCHGAGKVHPRGEREPA